MSLNKNRALETLSPPILIFKISRGLYWFFQIQSRSPILLLINSRGQDLKKPIKVPTLIKREK